VTDRVSQNASTASGSVRSTVFLSATITSSPRRRSVSATALPSAPEPPQTSATSATHELEELAPQLRVVLERAAPERRHGARVLLAAAHLRAEGRRLGGAGAACGRDQLAERAGDRLAEPLLHREPARVQPHQPRELGNADDLLAGDVADVCRAEER